MIGSIGQRLVAGSSANAPALPSWSDEKRAALRVDAETHADARVRAIVGILLDAFAGDHAAARAGIGRIVDEFANLYPSDGFTFEALLVASVVSGQWDIAPRILSDRFGDDWCSAVDVESLDPPGQTVRWEIDARGKSRFHFNDSMFASDGTWDLLLGWSRSLSLFHYYTTTAEPEHGSVMVSIGDSGSAPGLAPCECRPGHWLIPDPMFLNTSGYADSRAAFDAARVPWDDRKPVAFWRGASTGQRFGDWRGMPRFRLCLIAQTHIASGIVDAAISSLVGLPPEMRREAEAAGVLGEFVPPSGFMQFKYQIDIDGNTNAWAALFQKLLTGSPVLKVRSPFDYRQWYYDDLSPWLNYVPIEAEMGDLIEKIVWLRSHDDLARRIGENGLALARRLTFASELARSRATVSRALRYFSGRPEIVVDFGHADAETHGLHDNWSGIAVERGIRGRYPLRPLSRVRFPSPAGEGDLELRVWLVVVGGGAALPVRMIAAVNGIPIGEADVYTPAVESPLPVSMPVPRPVLSRCAQTEIAFRFLNPVDAIPALPAGILASHALFTRLELSAAS